MDWERTLNIFIVAFLILNIVFVVELWLRPIIFDPSNYISAEQIAATKNELEDRDITVTTKIPRRAKPLQSLGVSKTLRDEEEVVTALFGQEFEKVSSGVKSEYRSIQGVVDIYVDGRIYYFSSLTPQEGNISKSSVQSRADEFLENTVGRPKDAVAVRTSVQEEGFWEVEYKQRWNRKRLEISKIVVVVDQGGSILQMEYFWVEVIGYVGERLVSIPATTALKVAARQMHGGTTIADIYLSWYSIPVLADQWRVSPVWVVETEKGNTYYVNAHTGELEGNKSSQQENILRR